MSRLCIGTIIKALKLSVRKGNKISNRKICYALLFKFDTTLLENNDYLFSNLLRGTRNPVSYAIDTARNCNEEFEQDLLSYYKENLIPLLDSNMLNTIATTLVRIILEDDSISFGTVVNRLDGTTKESLGNNLSFSIELLTGIVIYTIANTNNKGRKSDIDEITEEYMNSSKQYLKGKLNEIEQNHSQENIDEEATIEARKFLLKYEEQKNLIVLCQVANYISPNQNHFRQMYTDYILCKKSVQKEIMRLMELPFYNFEPNGWEYKYLSYMEEDCEKYKLSSQHFLYDGGKYFHRITHYSYITNENMNPRIFPRVPSRFNIKNTPNNLLGYIDEYLYWKDDSDKFQYVSTPPMDYIDHLCDDYNSDSYLYWVNMFVMSACLVLRREKVMTYEDTINWTTPAFEELKTYEDLYFASLLTLYVFYNKLYS